MTPAEDSVSASCAGTDVSRLRDLCGDAPTPFTAALLECSPVLVADAGGTVLYANDALCALLRTPAEALVGRPAFFGRAGARTGEIETRAGDDGAPLWIEAAVTPLPGRAGTPALHLAVCRDVTARRAVERRLQEELDFSNLMFDTLPGAVFHIDDDLRLARWNRTFEQVTGYDAAAITGMRPHDFVAAEDRPRIAAAMAEVFETGHGQVEADFLTRDGRRLPHLLMGVRLERDGRRHLIGIGTDIAARKRMEDALREKTALFAAQVESSADGILVIDGQGRKVIQNRRLAEIWGVPSHIAADPDGAPQLEFIVERVTHPAEFRAKVDWLTQHPEAVSRDEIALVDGKVMDRYSAPVTDETGRVYGRIWAFRDITEQKRADRRIRQLAHYDVLTGLPNRVTFHARLDERLAAGEGRTGLLYVDLDGFKLINDTRGHPTGDAVLRQAAARLTALCDRPGMIVGRLGGDEFAVALPCAGADEAAAVAGRIIAGLSAPYRLENGRSFRIGASVGAALAPDDGTDADTLLARADIALYAAKTAGKGACKVFSPGMERRIRERMALETSLRAALETGAGLFVFHQPIVEIDTGRVTAREALIRWRHPRRGWVSPAEFVPIAEQSDLIDRLGRFVLERACREAAGWTDGARVAVNVSACQLGKGTLAPTVLAALVDSSLSPGALEIEVTETALLGDERDAMGELRRIRDMGVRVALDDFGAGYSSLAHLRAFPFDKIKIDGSFVKDAVDRPDCAAMVGAVADLGRRLGVTTVAEGVETQAHLDLIRREGCREAQGHFFGRPQPSAADAEAVAALDARPRRRGAAA